MITNVVSGVTRLDMKLVIVVGSIARVTAGAAVNLVITLRNAKGRKRSVQLLGRCSDMRRCVHLRNDLLPANKCWCMQNGTGSHGTHHERPRGSRSVG